MEKKISIKKAAEMLGKSEQFIRIGLQRGAFNFGTAVKMSTKWSYHISPTLFYRYLNGEEK